jgi:hypothetical protein
MSDSALKHSLFSPAKFRRVEEPANEPADMEGAEDLGSFGWLRGWRDRSVMLELRKRNGNSLAVDYGGMEIEFDPSEGITLHSLSGRTIHIKGRNLNAEVQPSKRLFDGLTRHRVPWIAEADRAQGLQADRDATVIESIDWV